MNFFRKYRSLLMILGFALIIFMIIPFHARKVLKHNFANVDDYKLFTNNEIKKSSNPQPWKISQNYNKKELSEEMINFMDKRKTCAFLVIQNDEIIYERYSQNYDKETITGSFSMAKSVISLMIGRLLDEGKIESLNDEIVKYIPELNKDRMVDVTIKDLLTMSAGIDFTESYWNPFTMTVEIYYGKNLDAILPRLKLKTEPGKIWEYQSISTQLLGHIVKNVSGKSLAEYSRELLWEPMGAENDILWSTDYDGGMEKAFCCINATARDFARLGKLMLQNGRWDTTQIISEEYIKEMTTPASHLKRADGMPTSWYGYQVWLIEKDKVQYPYFRGILGQLIYVIPEKNAVIVRLGKKISNKSNDTEHHLDDYEYLNAGLSLLD